MAVVSDDEEQVGSEGEEYEREDEVDEREDDDGDDDEEDEEVDDEYENDGFIVDDVDEEEEEDEDRQKKKKKNKRKRSESEKNYELDEDDYDLLEDNNVTVHRPSETKKFKRLKKAKKDVADERSELLKRALFDDDDGLEKLEEEQLEDEEDIEHEMDDFIVDDDQEVDELGIRVKRNKSRQAPGVLSSALQEARDIFGEAEEFIKLRKLDMVSKSNAEPGEWKTTHEPSVISEKYMTDQDDEVRKADVPERLQMFEKSIGNALVDVSSIEDESLWICHQLTTDMVYSFGRKVWTSEEGGHELSRIKEDIMRFLEFMHVQKLDVPYIAMYKKEQCQSLFRDLEHRDTDNTVNKSSQKPIIRWHKLLWAIVDLDRKWLLLQKRKNNLQLYYNKRYEEESRSISDETRLNLNKQLFESISKSLKAAESDREVDDVDLKFNMHFPPGDVGIDEGKYKRPQRKSRYASCSKAGLWEVACKFGYSSEQFGLQISLEKMRTDELEDAKETPEEMALNFTSAMFETPQIVLRDARHMAAVEISCEPCVRKHVRSIFMDNAKVSTCPTADGTVAIDTFHQYAGIKWLREKPLTSFEDAQWLLIQKAEEEKLIQVTIKLPEFVLNKLMSDARDYYLSDGVSKSAQLWNEQRKLILQDAFFSFLIPSMEKEARSLLTSRAKSWLLLDYGKRMWDKVSVAPYQQKESDASSEEEPAPRVMACCWGPGKPATTFVMLDSSGEVLDVLNAGSLGNRGQSVDEQQRKKTDQQRVYKFMTDHQVDLVILGAVNLSCTRLKEDIYETIFKMVQDHPREIRHDMDALKIIYGDETLPRLYENSHISEDQLPSQPGIVKRAVALGRYLQNPLAMIATLCGPGKEILSWKLSPMESFLNPDDKYGIVEQVMVDATNQVGLDINLAASHEWLFSSLQFVSGLGPRKAASLMKSLVRAGSIFTRKDLFTTYGLEKKVFVNAAGFLRVRRSGIAAKSSRYTDLLDDTRIHPESYGLAKELAKDVYLEDVHDDIDDDEDVLEMAIEHVRERPHLLKSLEVHQYAKSKQYENKLETQLNNIRLELIQGFQDWRKEYAEPTQDEEFYMISGETEDTIAEERIVQATIRRVQPQRAVCILDSGLTGILSKEDYTDNWRDVTDLTEKLNEGDILTCRIKSILKKRYQVFLSCKESEMRSDRYQNHRKLDPYYHEDHSQLAVSQDNIARKQKELAKKHLKPRMIVHPRFQNITADEAMELLSDKDPGESVVRPSSRSPSYLSLTIKIYDEVYAHKEIVEGGKEKKDIISMLRIGKTLKIGEDTFEDLDEVMDRYVDPLIAHLKTMLSYRKFKKGSKAEIDGVLRSEKADYPARIVYCFGISHEHPGTFILTYIRSTNPHHEYIGMYPKGFKFRNKMFENIDHLVAYFQRHIDDPHDLAAPSIRSVAAMVPLQNTPPGGSSRGWSGYNANDGSWRGQSRDRDRTCSMGARTHSGHQDRHPSGLPRPYGDDLRSGSRQGHTQW
ncbi:Transcription elongation factor spt6 [Heracleum sosnowskyi]|uniref:Transcription elongation factor spt6 n=1 Tax=Heracleum sosnowskyi TaxID=360622 RepID=A0AAD8IHW1_9APIA|nr:Transcription elongation factor spt6 [Heracleum sosnowskyi]